MPMSVFIRLLRPVDGGDAVVPGACWSVGVLKVIDCIKWEKR
jgi:hypothetical protein